jgi:hypothetical protein
MSFIDINNTGGGIYVNGRRFDYYVDSTQEITSNDKYDVSVNDVEHKNTKSVVIYAAITDINGKETKVPLPAGRTLITVNSQSNVNVKCSNSSLDVTVTAYTTNVSNSNGPVNSVIKGNVGSLSTSNGPINITNSNIGSLGNASTSNAKVIINGVQRY